MAAQAQTVLVVEDESSIASFVALYLKNAGYGVRTAATGGDALTQAESEQPDLIVLDLMLPDIDGIEVCRRIRKNSDVPILMLTARDEDVDKIIGLEVGADDYLTKPFGPSELVARIRALLRRTSAGSRERPLEFGALRIDPERREAERDGARIELTTLEFDLLWFLASRPGRVFSREQLMEQVWNDRVVGDRSIDSLVSRLRKKIELDADDPQLLQTVWGAGYRFSR